MNICRKVCLILASACVALVLMSCERGPLEKAGKKVDDAVEKTGDKLKGE